MSDGHVSVDEVWLCFTITDGNGRADGVCGSRPSSTLREGRRTELWRRHSLDDQESPIGRKPNS